MSALCMPKTGSGALSVLESLGHDIIDIYSVNCDQERAGKFRTLTSRVTLTITTGWQRRDRRTRHPHQGKDPRCAGHVPRRARWRPRVRR